MIFFLPYEELCNELPRKANTATEVGGQGSKETLSRGTHRGSFVYDAVVSRGREKGGEQ